MGANVTLNDIDTAHRIPTRNSSSNNLKTIICKFVRRISREEVLLHRRVITEVDPKVVLSYDPYGPARAFIAKLLRNPRMGAVRDGASRAGKSRPALLGSQTALCEMQTETTLLLYKSRLFGQNERGEWTFR